MFSCYGRSASSCCGPALVAKRARHARRRFAQTVGRLRIAAGRGTLIESLEERRLFTLLGIDTGSSYPNIVSQGPPGNITYSNGVFNDTTTNISLLESPGVVDPITPSITTGSASSVVMIAVDNMGNLVGSAGPGLPPADIQVQGHVTVNNNGVPTTYDGVLLSGSIVAFGYQFDNSPLPGLVPSTAEFDFDFKVTGGALASYFAGQDIGMTSSGVTLSTFSDNPFTGTFQVDGNKSNVAPIPSSNHSNKSTPIITTAQQPATATVGTGIADKATVSGSATGTVTFNLYSNATATGPALFTDTETLVSGVATSATYTTTATGTDYWVASYNGDSNNYAVTSDPAAEPVTVNPATPSISTVQQPATATVGTSIADKATVAGGFNPTGTVTFNLYSNSAATGTPLFTDANEPLSGGTATSKSYTATAVGTDYWVATYNGDSNNASVTSGTTLEPVTVTPATPAINTVQQPATATVGTSIADKATITGGFNPTGTVTFNLYSNSTATGAPLFTDTEALSSGTATSKGYTTTAAGTDYWVATYNGDSNNAKITSGTALEPVVITPATPVSAGQFATIGFWHNQNGQAVINSFNGGPTHTQLGNWLATNFPHLFGSPNPYDSSTLTSFHATSFAGLTNAQIATVYANLWTPTGVTKNTYVQAFAVALGLYADTTSLGGASLIANGLGAAFGFKITNAGAGTIGLGGNAAAFLGLTSNPLVYQILLTVDANFSPSTGQFYGGNQTLTSEANNVLNKINTTGDITLVTDGSASTGTDQPLITALHPLAAGIMFVAVDTASFAGDPLGAAEEAQIADAISLINTALSSRGVTVVEIQGDDSVPADVHVHLAATSAIGGVGQGVLGVTQSGGTEITLISGWNYYTGIDPSAIGANQYDFETVASHELGHALGLGHSTDTNSVMYPYLGIDQVRRQLTANDLAIIDQASGNAPEPLLAASAAKLKHHKHTHHEHKPGKPQTPVLRFLRILGNKMIG